MTSATGQFQIDRTIAAPPARLWSLLTDPQAREAWGAPSDDAVLILDTADLREGGQERHRCGPKEAPDFIVDTHWYHLDAPLLACFTETLTIGTDRLAVSLVTYRLAPAETGCHLTVEVAVSSMSDEPVTEDFLGGWTSSLDRLERMIADNAFA